MFPFETTGFASIVMTLSSAPMKFIYVAFPASHSTSQPVLLYPKHDLLHL